MIILSEIRRHAERCAATNASVSMFGPELIELLDALDAAMAEIAHRRTPAWLYDPEWRDKAKMLATATDSAMERLK